MCKGQFDCLLVGLARTYDSIARPHRNIPLPLFYDLRICSQNQPSHSSKRLTSPTFKLLNSFVNFLRCVKVCGVLIRNHDPRVPGFPPLAAVHGWASSVMMSAWDHVDRSSERNTHIWTRCRSTKNPIPFRWAASQTNKVQTLDVLVMTPIIITAPRSPGALGVCSFGSSGRNRANISKRCARSLTRVLCC